MDVFWLLCDPSTSPQWEAMAAPLPAGQSQCRLSRWRSESGSGLPQTCWCTCRGTPSPSAPRWLWLTWLLRLHGHGDREREKGDGHKHNIKDGQTLVSSPQYSGQSGKTGLLLAGRITQRHYKLSEPTPSVCYSALDTNANMHESFVKWGKHNKCELTEKKYR